MASGPTPSHTGAGYDSDPTMPRRPSKLTMTLKDLPSEVITRIVSLAKDVREDSRQFQGGT